MGKRGQTWDVVRDDDTDVEEDVDIAQAREIHLSSDGRRVLETPRSPQKRFSLAAASSSRVVDSEETFDPANELNFDLAEDETAPPTVGANLAKKRYPASVSSSYHSFMSIPC